MEAMITKEAKPRERGKQVAEEVLEGGAGARYCSPLQMRRFL